MLLIAGTIRFPADRMAEARTAIARVVAATRAEEGCLDYSFAEDVLDPGLVHLREFWRDQAALDAHFATPHLLAWREDGARLGVHERDLKLYAVGEGRAI